MNCTLARDAISRTWVKQKRSTRCFKNRTETRLPMQKPLLKKPIWGSNWIVVTFCTVWMSLVMRLSDKTCVQLRGLLGFPGDREPHEKRSSFSSSCHCLCLCLYISIPLSSLPLPSVHLNCRRASSSWQDKIECAHQHRLPSSRVLLFDQLIRESNQA